VEDIKISDKSPIVFKKDRKTGLSVSTSFYDFLSMEKTKDVCQ
jgi:hypothetical protein